MDPVTTTMLISGGLNLLGGLLGGDDQPNRRPFKGRAQNGMNLDPKELLGNSLAMLYSTAGAMQDQFSRPVNLRTAYAQPVAGLSGVDPAFGNRTLLRRPGMDFSGGAFTSGGSPSNMLSQLGINNPNNAPKPNQSVWDRVRNGNWR